MQGRLPVVLSRLVGTHAWRIAAGTRGGRCSAQDPVVVLWCFVCNVVHVVSLNKRDSDPNSTAEFICKQVDR